MQLRKETIVNWVGLYYGSSPESRVNFFFICSVGTTIISLLYNTAAKTQKKSALGTLNRKSYID